MSTKKITVKVDESTFRWLKAFAKAQSGSTLNPEKVTAGDLLGSAAFCIADHAGRRTGSWEAEVGRQMMVSSGYQNSIEGPALSDLHQDDEVENQAARERAFGKGKNEN